MALRANPGIGSCTGQEGEAAIGLQCEHGSLPLNERVVFGCVLYLPIQEPADAPKAVSSRGSPCQATDIEPDVTIEALPQEALLYLIAES